VREYQKGTRNLQGQNRRGTVYAHDDAVNKKKFTNGKKLKEMEKDQNLESRLLPL
jgi:hypothetical protein